MEIAAHVTIIAVIREIIISTGITILSLGIKAEVTIIASVIMMVVHHDSHRIIHPVSVAHCDHFPPIQIRVFRQRLIDLVAQPVKQDIRQPMAQVLTFVKVAQDFQQLAAMRLHHVLETIAHRDTQTVKHLVFRALNHLDFQPQTLRIFQVVKLINLPQIMIFIQIQHQSSNQMDTIVNPSLHCPVQVTEQAA